MNSPHLIHPGGAGLAASQSIPEAVVAEMRQRLARPRDRDSAQWLLSFIKSGSAGAHPGCWGKTGPANPI
ncbi:MAG: hypothetical protein ACE5H9_11570 [Anaerolineae bacterium]